MVAYLLIIFFTVLFLTFLTYKVASFLSYDFAPNTLFLCAFFACILGLLVPRVVAYGSNITMWLIALLSMLVLSSYVLSRSAIMVRDTAETNSRPSYQQETPEEIKSIKEESPLITSSAMAGSGINNAFAPAAQDMSTVSTSNREIEESVNVVVPEKVNDVIPLPINEIEDTMEDLPAIIGFSEITSPVESEALYMPTTGDAVESNKVYEEQATVIDEIKVAVEGDPPVIVGSSEVTSAETEDLYIAAAGKDMETSEVYEDPVPVIDEVKDTVEEDLPVIVHVSEVTSPVEREDLCLTTTSEADVSDKVHENPAPAIDEIEDTGEEDIPSIVEISETTTSVGVDALCTAEGGDMEKSINNNESENHDIAYYLDLGFAARESGDYRVATTAFQKAIDIEPDNPSILYIVIEICALLKLQGFYDDAIGKMQKGRDLALSFNNERMAEEFIDGIAYLRILKNALLTKSMQFTPYPALPEDVKLEIDEEFRQWKAQAD